MSASAVNYAVPPEPLRSVGLHVARRTVGRRAVLTVSGEIDMGSVPILEKAVAMALADGAAQLWIDLAMVEFMDSTGLHLLLDTRRHVCELNRRMAIICPDGRIRRLFDIAGLTDQLPLYHDRAVAHRAG
jgi:anti-sigma B factor antagonist